MRFPEQFRVASRAGAATEKVAQNQYFVEHLFHKRVMKGVALHESRTKTFFLGEVLGSLDIGSYGVEPRDIAEPPGSEGPDPPRPQPTSKIRSVGV